MSNIKFEYAPVPYLPVATSPNHFLNRSQVMLDLETLDTSPQAAVWQFGVAIWNPSAPQTINNLQLTLNPYDAANLDNVTVSQSTIEWQEQKNKENYDAALTLPRANLKEIKVIMQKFMETMAMTIDGKPSDAVYWSKSSSFDFPIFENFLKRVVDLPVPWKYWNIQELRTFMLLKEIPRTSFSHEAMDDAFQQLQLILNEYA